MKLVAGELRPANKSAENIEESLAKIVGHIAARLDPNAADDRKASGMSEFAEKGQYAQILEAVGKLEKSLPRSRTVTFRLTRYELGVLLTYALGGLSFLWLATRTANVAWTADNLVSVLAYWTAIVAIVLGSQAIPKIIRSSL